jgi:hypothetical protein
MRFFLFCFISFRIIGTFQDADSVSFCTASNVRIVGESGDGKNLKVNSVFMIRGTIPETVYKHWVKWRNMLRMTSFQAGITSDHLLNVNAKLNCSNYCEVFSVNGWSELRYTLHGTCPRCARSAYQINCSLVEYRKVILEWMSMKKNRTVCGLDSCWLTNKILLVDTQWWICEFHTHRLIILAEILLVLQWQFLLEKFFTHFPTKVPSDFMRRMHSLNLQ